MSGSEQSRVDWKHATVDPGTSWIYYRCTECGRELTVSPRAKTRVLPCMYCDCDETGYPFNAYKVKFHDGTVVERP